MPPDAAYLGYIDLRVLCLLLCLMAVVAGFQSCGAFRWLAGHLLSRGTGPRALAVILVLLPFFCSMAVTNDVALITFAPFALLLLDQMDCRAAAVPLLVLQTIAANLGSMATPVGNPQNLYLYGAYGLSAGDFFPVVLPLAGISLACLTATALPVLPRDLQIPPGAPAAPAAAREVGPVRRTVPAVPADGVPHSALWSADGSGAWDAGRSGTCSAAEAGCEPVVHLHLLLRGIRETWDGCLPFMGFSRVCWSAAPC